MCFMSQRSVVPLATGDLRASTSLSPLIFLTSDSRWYCSSACSTSRSSPVSRGGLRSATTGFYVRKRTGGSAIGERMTPFRAWRRSRRGTAGPVGVAQIAGPLRVLVPVDVAPPMYNGFAPTVPVIPVGILAGDGPCHAFGVGRSSRPSVQGGPPLIPRVIGPGRERSATPPEAASCTSRRRRTGRRRLLAHGAHAASSGTSPTATSPHELFRGLLRPDRTSIGDGGGRGVDRRAGGIRPGASRNGPYLRKCGRRRSAGCVIHAPAMDAYFAALHDLWSREEAPSANEERALMSRFGWNRHEAKGSSPEPRGRSPPLASNCGPSRSVVEHLVGR